MRIPNPCKRCSDIPLEFRCSDSFCVECPVFVEFFFADAYEQISFDDLLSEKPLSFLEYVHALVAKKERSY